MDKHWLVKQLPRCKQRSPMWQGFADALSSIYSDHIQPLVTRVASMNSMFAMNDEDLQKKLDEMGSFFYLTGNIDNEDLPLAMSQKLDEIHFKMTDLPISNTISRGFNGLYVEWAPYYAPLNVTPNGSTDYTQKQVNGSVINALKTKYEIDFLGENINDFFMTSRGVIQIALTRLSEKQINQEEFSSAIRRLIRPIIPLDIVFDGELIFVEYSIVDAMETILTQSNELTNNTTAKEREKAYFDDLIRQSFLLNNAIPNNDNYRVRIDETPVDAWFLDSL